MMKWADEMAYNAATLEFPEATFVTKLFGEFNFTRPVVLGDIIKIFAQVKSFRTTSCEVLVWGNNARTEEEVFKTFAVMVNAVGGRKIPLPKRRTSRAETDTTIVT
jgi:acyl-CoA hydrolase